MKIAFMGSDPIALSMLDFLQSGECSGARVEAVFTQPDRRTGRGMHLHVNEIKAWAQSRSVEVLQPRKCGKPEADYLRSNGFDLVLVMAYGQILPGCILEATDNKVLNIHASLLPRLRGASPIHTAVASGFEKTGISMMEIVPQLDAGPVADREEILIASDATMASVIESMARATVPLVRRTLQNLNTGKLEFIEQNPEEVTYCRIIEKTDRHLDFRKPAMELNNRIRAFQPWPGTTFPVDQIEVRICDATVEPADHVAEPAGTVRLTPGGMHVACGRDYLKPLILQRPGGRPMMVDEFLRGFAIADGRVLESREMRPLEARHPFPYTKKSK